MRLAEGDPHASGAPRSTPSATVLIVDDDPAMRVLLRDFLERDGHRVLEGADGEHALDLVEAERLDLVILDKQMPGMSGFDLLAFLRQRCPQTPVIFVTAFGGPRVAAEALRRGARRYFEKPFRLREVLEAVRALVGPNPGPRP